MKKLLALLLCLGLSLSACAALPSILHAVDSAITDSDQALKIIETTYNFYQTQHPVTPEERATFEKLLGAAYATLKTGAKIVDDAKGIDQGNYDAAFADFKTAFLALKDYLKSKGVSPIGAGMIGASQADVDGFPTPAVIGLKIQ